MTLAFQRNVSCPRFSRTKLDRLPKSSDPSEQESEAEPFRRELIAAAQEKLSWEVALEKQSGPVLDLSSARGSDDLGLSEAASVARESLANKKKTCDTKQKDINVDDGEITRDDWQSGEIWRKTRQALMERFDDDTEVEEDMLAACPQLARLPTENIVAAAGELIDALEISSTSMSKHPAMLSYPAPYFPGAIEFLSDMMMLPKPTIKSLCKANPELLIGGLDGYIQEQAVKTALGSAGDALYGVGRSVAADLGGMIQEKKNLKGL